MRRSFRIRVACERLRARRKPGTAIAASSAIIATTIMISTRVKPPRFLFSLFNILFVCFRLSIVCLTAIRDIDRGHAPFEQRRCQPARFSEFLERSKPNPHPIATAPAGRPLNRARARVGGTGRRPVTRAHRAKPNLKRPWTNRPGVGHGGRDPEGITPAYATVPLREEAQ